MILRDYQEKCNASIFKAWETSASTLAVLPTGAGKTICFAHIIKSIAPGRAMVLAHRNELIVQAKDKIETVTGMGVEIEKADIYASTSLFNRTPVVVSSIQTQCSGPKDKRRYLKFDPMDFSVLICDEGHHATAKSWKEVIDHYRKNPKLKVLGVTATPDRSDREALGQVFESVAFEYGILDAIQDGWLVEITQQFIAVKGLDYSHIRTTAGDLNEGDLSKVMEIEENIQGVCQPTLEVIFGLPPKTLDDINVPDWRNYLAGLNRKPRRTIVFTVSVAQAEHCCNVFRRVMDGVEWVCGKTRHDDRRDMLSRFADGETHVMVNCSCLTEGFDNPGVEVIAVARPTKSRALYSQMIGRSTRPLPGLVDGLRTAEERRAAIAASQKGFCRVLDFVGNSGKHKLISCADVLGGKVSEEAVEAAKAKALKDGKPVKILVTMQNAEEELKRERREAARQQEEARKAHLVARSIYRTQAVDPFGQKERQFAREYSRDGYTFGEKQVAILRKLGCDPMRLGYRQGQAIIAKYKSKPSDSQARLIVRLGGNPAGLTMDQASALISKLKGKSA